MVDVVGRRAEAVAPGGHLLVVVGHAAPAVEQRPHPHTLDGETVEIDDSVLLARRRT